MRVLRTVLTLAALMAGPWAHAAVGVFTETSGDVKFLRGDYYFEAAAGVEVEAEDLVETGNAATAQLDMGDGSMLRIGPNSQLALTDYRLDDDGNVIAAGIEVVSGWLRFAVSKLRHDANYRIETSTMTIGIRGTEGVIEAQDSHGGLYLEEGVVAVNAADAVSSGQGTSAVRAGEYIERARGQSFARPSSAPPAFRNRMPPVFRERLQRRAQLLKARGIPPRQIRHIQGEDAQRYLKNHPHMRPHLQQRMHKQLQTHPELRRQVQKNNQTRRLEHRPRRAQQGTRQGNR